jgi:hypothetical protein
LKDNVIKTFREIEGSAIDEERYGALKAGDRILVQLDGEQPEVRKFAGFGVRSLLIATRYMGHDYSYFFIDGSHPRNPQTSHHLYAVDKSRFRGLAPSQ